MIRNDQNSLDRPNFKNQLLNKIDWLVDNGKEG